MSEGGGEARPAVGFGEQVGDADGRHHAVEAPGQGLGFLRRGSPQRRHLHLTAPDAHVLKSIGGRLRSDLGEAPVKERASLREVFLRCRRHGDGERSGLAHRDEQRGRDELVLDGAPLPAALHPDVPRAQPIAQREQRRRLPGPAVGDPFDALHRLAARVGRRNEIGRLRGHRRPPVA